MRIWRFENSVKTNATKRAWARRNPGKAKAATARWLAKNMQRVRAYQTWYRARMSRDKRLGYDLKHLAGHPERSLFPVCYSLEAPPVEGWSGPWESQEFASDSLSPLELLMLKEEALAPPSAELKCVVSNRVFARRKLPHVPKL